MRCGLRNKPAGVNPHPFGAMEAIIQKKSMVLQYGLSGSDKVDGSSFLAFSLWQTDSAKAELMKEALVPKIGERKRGTSQSEVPLFV